MLDDKQKAVLELTHLLRKRVAVRQWLLKPEPGCYACACMGKQYPSDPDCHCAMKFIEDAAGIYYSVQTERSEDGIRVTADRADTRQKIIPWNIDGPYVPHYKLIPLKREKSMFSARKTFNLSPAEWRAAAVSAGVITEDGELTERYRPEQE